MSVTTAVSLIFCRFLTSPSSRDVESIREAHKRIWNRRRMEIISFMMTGLMMKTMTRTLMIFNPYFRTTTSVSKLQYFGPIYAFLHCNPFFLQPK